MEVVSREEFRVIGVELTDAERRSYLIMQLWVSLCPKLRLVQHQVEPRILYGVWRQVPGDDQPRYVVGVQVPELEAVPEGMVGVTVPASRFVVAVHRGNMARIGETYQAITSWMREAGAEHNEAATFEVYDTTQPVTDGYAVPIYEPIK